MAADSSRITEFKAAPMKMLALAGAGVLMTAVSAALAFDWLPDMDSFGHFIGWFGLLFFGLCTLILLWRAFTMRGAVVTMAPQGIRDIRLAAEFIPWSAVRRVSTWRFGGQRLVVLAVDPAVEARLTLTHIARWTRAPNRGLGADGLCVTAQGLNADHETLFAACAGYWGAHRTLRQAPPSAVQS